MPSFTKRAIIESFLHLAGKKPLDKITVRDIVDDCGVNRNTFYYYFQDIYAVLEELCEGIIKNIPADKPLSETLSAFYRALAGFTAKYPHAAKCFALSLGFEGMERYFGMALDGVILDCCTRGEGGAVPSDTMLKFLRCGVLGLCLDALRGEKGCERIADELEALLAAATPGARPDAEQNEKQNGGVPPIRVRQE